MAVEDDLFHYTISAFNAVCTAGMSYHDVAATTKLYGRANSLESITTAARSPNVDIRTAAVEALGKLCGSHVGMCQHLKDLGGVPKFMHMLDPSCSQPELRGLVTSLMTMTRRAEVRGGGWLYSRIPQRCRPNSLAVCEGASRAGYWSACALSLDEADGDRRAGLNVDSRLSSEYVEYELVCIHWMGYCL